jgi:hypothetical protein
MSGLSPQRLTPLARDPSPRGPKSSARQTIDWTRKPTGASFTRPSVRRCEPRPAGARPSRIDANAGERSARVGAHTLAWHRRPSLVMMESSPVRVLVPYLGGRIPRHPPKRERSVRNVRAGDVGPVRPWPGGCGICCSGHVCRRCPRRRSTRIGADGNTWVGTRVGTRWEQTRSPRGASSPLVSLRKMSICRMFWVGTALRIR